MPHGDTSWWERIRLQIPIRGRQGPRKDLPGKCRYYQGTGREEVCELLWSQMGLKYAGYGASRCCIALLSRKWSWKSVSRMDTFRQFNPGRWSCITIRVWWNDSSVTIHLYLQRRALGSLNLVQPILSGTIWHSENIWIFDSGWTESISVCCFRMECTISSLWRLTVVLYSFPSIRLNWYSPLKVIRIIQTCLLQRHSNA